MGPEAPTVGCTDGRMVKRRNSIPSVIIGKVWKMHIYQVFLFEFTQKFNLVRHKQLWRFMHEWVNLMWQGCIPKTRDCSHDFSTPCYIISSQHKHRGMIEQSAPCGCTLWSIILARYQSSLNTQTVALLDWLTAQHSIPGKQGQRRLRYWKSNPSEITVPKRNWYSPVHILSLHNLRPILTDFKHD